jgi:thiamine biosynthesis lipoprotein
MNTYMTITCYGPEAQEAVDAAKAIIFDLENQISRQIDSSEISLINAQSGKGPVTVSDETIALVSEAMVYKDQTGGAFDITIGPIMDLWGFGSGSYQVPSRAMIDAVLPLVNANQIILDLTNHTVELPVAGMLLDLGGIGKGYASDQVIQLLLEYDVSAALVNLGGNVSVMGPKTDGTLWRIGIADPVASDSGAFDLYVGVLSGTDVSVITSGGYERFFEQDGKRYIHIMDPKTGEPAQSDLLSVSIVSGDGVQGDCLSTALFVMGKEKAMAYWRENRDFSCILVTTEGEVLASSDLSDSFTLADSQSKYILTFFD